MAKKVAEQLVDMLVEAGVKRIYAVTGDSLNEINDAVRKMVRFSGFTCATRKSGPMRLGRRLNYTGNWLVVPEVVVRDTFI